MYLLTAVQPQQPDYIALGMFVVIVIAALAMALRKYLRSKKPAPVSSEPAAPVEPTAPAAVAPGSAGVLKLHDVEPKTAAMLMAIVADKIGKPLNELRFISIKEVK